MIENGGRADVSHWRSGNAGLPSLSQRAENEQYKPWQNKL